jgi:hypothetical protein
MAKQAPVLRSDVLLEAVQQLDPSPGNAGRDQAAVLGVPLPTDESCRFHAIQEPRHVRHPGQHAVPHLVAAQALRLRSAQDPEHVVLRGRNSCGAQNLFQRVTEEASRTHDAQMRLLFRAPERACLTNLVAQRVGHVCNIGV